MLSDRLFGSTRKYRSTSEQAIWTLSSKGITSGMSMHKTANAPFPLYIYITSKKDGELSPIIC